jgi:hypothetical protein
MSDSEYIGRGPMTVNDLIAQLSRLSEEMREKPVKVVCPNGLEVEPVIRFERINKWSLNASPANTKAVFLTWRA